MTGSIWIGPASSVCAQTSSYQRWTAGLSMGVTCTQVYGDLKDSNFQAAADQSTIWGLTVKYHDPWSVGPRLGTTVGFWPTRHLGMEVGFGINNQRLRESFISRHDPPYNTIVSGHVTVTQNLLYAIPELGLAIRWRWVTARAGATTNLYVIGATTKAGQSTSTDGTTRTWSETSRLDTQDQPIYLDPNQFGGLVDYTHYNPRNHGANPVWLSTYLGATGSLWEDRASPFVSFQWNFAMQEAFRSHNPQYSLQAGLSYPYDEDINLGSKFKSFSVSIGYRF